MLKEDHLYRTDMVTTMKTVMEKCAYASSASSTPKSVSNTRKARKSKKTRKQNKRIY